MGNSNAGLGVLGPACSVWMVATFLFPLPRLLFSVVGDAGGFSAGRVLRVARRGSLVLAGFGGATSTWGAVPGGGVVSRTCEGPLGSGPVVSGVFGRIEGKKSGRLSAEPMGSPAFRGTLVILYLLFSMTSLVSVNPRLSRRGTLQSC